jgi:hypothetical protein
MASDLAAARRRRLRRRNRRVCTLAVIIGVIGSFGAALAPSAEAASGGATAPAGSTGSTGATTGSTGSTGTSGSTGSSASNPSVSSNWAGYAVTGPAGLARHFKHLTGSWVQPAATCTPGSSSYSAYWVGLGGFSQSSRKLEQVGTEADCDTSGVASYYAWYELVPSAPVTLKLAIAPGDTIRAAVSVKGAYVTVTLADQTRGTRISKRLHFAAPDTSSAEWIAEAPSACNSTGACEPLPLADFGTVDFSDAETRIADGHSGAISNPYWSAEPIALEEAEQLSGGVGGGGFFGPRALVGAAPTVLADAGSSFAVSWSQQTPTAPSGGGRVFPGAGP